MRSNPRPLTGHRPPTVDDAVTVVRAWAANPRYWRTRVRHEPGRRCWEPLPVGGGLVAWAISWAPGSGLPMHDHGGAAGAFGVVAGTLTEAWARAGGHPAIGTRSVERGSLVRFGPEHLHEVRNDALVPAVSIHVYTDTLDDMAFHDVETGIPEVVPWQ